APLLRIKSSAILSSSAVLTPGFTYGRSTSNVWATSRPDSRRCPISCRDFKMTAIRFSTFFVDNPGVAFTGTRSPPQGGPCSPSTIRLDKALIHLRTLFPGEQIAGRHIKVAVKVGQQMVDRRVIDPLALTGIESRQNAQRDTTLRRQAAQTEWRLPLP